MTTIDDCIEKIRTDKDLVEAMGFLTINPEEMCDVLCQRGRLQQLGVVSSDELLDKIIELTTYVCMGYGIEESDVYSTMMDAMLGAVAQVSSEKRLDLLDTFLKIVDLDSKQSSDATYQFMPTFVYRVLGPLLLERPKEEELFRAVDYLISQEIFFGIRPADQLIDSEKCLGRELKPFSYKTPLTLDRKYIDSLIVEHGGEGAGKMLARIYTITNIKPTGRRNAAAVGASITYSVNGGHSQMLNLKYGSGLKGEDLFFMKTLCRSVPHEAGGRAIQHFVQTRL